MWNVFSPLHDISTSSSFVKCLKIKIKLGNTLHALKHVILFFTNGSVFVTKTSGAVKPRDYCQQIRFLLYPPNFLHGLRCIVRGDWDYRLLADISASAQWVDACDIGATVYLGLLLRSSGRKKEMQCIPLFLAECLCIDYFRVKLSRLRALKTSLPSKTNNPRKRRFFANLD